MGINSSSSSTSSSKPNDSDCYIHNKMIRQQCLRTRLDNEYIIPKPYFDGKNLPSMTYTGKTQIGCDNQGNVIECDENGQVIRVIKQNNR